jgi:hypothetical protein
VLKVKQVFIVFHNTTGCLTLKKNGKQLKHNKEACWIKNLCQQNPSVEWSLIPEKEVTVAKKSQI